MKSMNMNRMLGSLKRKRKFWTLQYLRSGYTDAPLTTGISSEPRWRRSIQRIFSRHARGKCCEECGMLTLAGYHLRETC